MVNDQDIEQRLSVDLRLQFEEMHSLSLQQGSALVGSPEQMVLAMHSLVRDFVAQVQSDPHWAVRLVEDTDTTLTAVLIPQPQTIATNWEVHFATRDGRTCEVNFGTTVPPERTAATFYGMSSTLWITRRPHTWIGRSWVKLRTAYLVRARPALRDMPTRHNQDHDR